jgi:Ca-activated chloride channel family protein
MYDQSYQGSSRIKQAKIALNSFLDHIEQPKSGKESLDMVAVYSFNTMLTEVAPLGSPATDIRRRLSVIERPEAGMAYTELYNSLVETGGNFQKSAGRRAVIVLSDGENYPLIEHGTSEHPVWGTDVAAPDDIINTAHETGMTIDGINISDNMDGSLVEICSATGGEFFDVRSTSEITEVYNSIRDRITNEYRLTVTAPPLGDGFGEIELEYNGHSDSRPLHIPLLFGGSSKLPTVFSLILLLAGITGIAVLYIIPFDKPVKNAQLQGLNSHQKTILNEDVTIIGASREADYTIAGNPAIDAQHATILHDSKTGEYTIVSEKTVRVNNRKVKTQKLTPGDVIRIEGSTVVFDKPENKE